MGAMGNSDLGDFLPLLENVTRSDKMKVGSKAKILLGFRMGRGEGKIEVGQAQ